MGAGRSAQLSCITILSARRFAPPLANKMFGRCVAAPFAVCARCVACYAARYKASSGVFLLFSNVALTPRLSQHSSGTLSLCILVLHTASAQAMT